MRIFVLHNLSQQTLGFLRKLWMDDIVLLFYIIIYSSALNCLESCLPVYRFVPTIFCVWRFHWPYLTHYIMAMVLYYRIDIVLIYEFWM